MKKLTIIGAGSVMFTRQILSAVFSYPALKDMEIVLEDLNEAVLERTYKLISRLVEQEGIHPKISMTTNQKESLKGADFVISAIQVGGLEPWYLDVDIPKKYGVIQEAGDTIGPGGIFRGMRHIPALLSVVKDMEEVCPEALLINYANPLAPLTWAVTKASGINVIGLCYGVRYTTAQLAGYLGVGPWVEHPYTPKNWNDLMYYEVPENMEYHFGGINHMTWLLDIKVDGKDMYPKIREMWKDPKVYAADGVRCEILKHFDYWGTENHWHFSDYVPYFRKNPEMIKKYIPRSWNLMELEEELRISDNAQIDRQIAGRENIRVDKNMLNAPKIINAMVSGEVTRVNGNVKNNGLIGNLPSDCIVEVPIYVDQNGLHPVYVGKLPTQCAALNRTNINVHELIAEAGVNTDKMAAKYAMQMDPVTSMVCELDQIDKMFNEMFEAQRKWLEMY